MDGEVLIDVGDRVVFRRDLTERPTTARCGTVREATLGGWLHVEFDHQAGFRAVQRPEWLEPLARP